MQDAPRSQHEALSRNLSPDVSQSATANAERLLKGFSIPQETLKSVYGAVWEQADLKSRDTSGRIAHWKARRTDERNSAAETFGSVTEAAVGFLLQDAFKDSARIVKTTEPDDHGGADFVVEFNAPPPNLLAIDVTHGSKNLYDAKLADIEHDARFGVMQEIRFFLPHFARANRRQTHLMPKIVIGFDADFARSCCLRPIWDAAQQTKIDVGNREKMLVTEVKLGLLAQLAIAKVNKRDSSVYQSLIRLLPRSQGENLFGRPEEDDNVYVQIAAWARRSVQQGLAHAA